MRQAPIEVDAHNPKIVYHGSQYVHKTIDGGLHWTRFSPDVTANGPEGQVTSGEPITRDMTGEEVYAALYSMRVVAPRAGRVLDRIERRSGVGDARTTARRGRTSRRRTCRRAAACTRSRIRRTARARRTSRSTGCI